MQWQNTALAVPGVPVSSFSSSSGRCVRLGPNPANERPCRPAVGGSQSRGPLRGSLNGAVDRGKALMVRSKPAPASPSFLSLLTSSLPLGQSCHLMSSPRSCHRLAVSSCRLATLDFGFSENARCVVRNCGGLWSRRREQKQRTQSGAAERSWSETRLEVAGLLW